MTLTPKADNYAVEHMFWHGVCRCGIRRGYQPVGLCTVRLEERGNLRVAELADVVKARAAAGEQPTAVVLELVNGLGLVHWEAVVLAERLADACGIVRPRATGRLQDRI